MKILVIGSGGREHALAWKFSQSSKAEKIFAAPGNCGIAGEAKCENIALTADTEEGQEKLLQFALREKTDLTVIGPELPLAMGLADLFRAAGLAVIGPGKEAAQLESSKIYSKAFMAKYGVRTASGSSFTDPEKACVFAAAHFNAASAPPLVIKADGLAAGKGVIIAENVSQANAAITGLMLEKNLGAAGDALLLEEFLEGSEVSVLAAVSVSGGSGYILPFISARDHKRRFEAAKGPNTGGMGAIAPVLEFTQRAQLPDSLCAEDDFLESILKPTLKGLESEGLDYRGFIFFGLMVQAGHCYLLEYNVRLGDPETQAVLPLMDFDLVDLCEAILAGKKFPLAWKPGSVCAPVAVADGYPGTYRKGDAIAIDAEALEKSGAKIFISGATGSFPGTSAEKKDLRTSGGRVLTVSAYGANADEAYSRAYHGLDAVSFNGMGFRRDIGRESAG